MASEVSAQRFVPEVETRDGVQTDVFVSPGRAVQTPVDRFPSLAACAAERAGTLGDVVFEEVDPRVGRLPQVGGGHVRQAGGLLVVFVPIGVRVQDLLQPPVSCGQSEPGQSECCIVWRRETGHRPTRSEGVPVDYSRQEAAQSAYREVTHETAQLLPDLVPLKTPLRPWSDTDI